MDIEEKKAKRRCYLRSYQGKWVSERRKKWLLENGPCRKCGSWDRLEVDHIDPRKKITHAFWSWSHERMMEELSKCQPLCHSCHKEKTRDQLRSRMTGSRGTPKILTDMQVREIRRQISEGATRREIAEAHGLHHSTITRIANGQIWSWLDREGSA